MERSGSSVFLMVCSMMDYGKRQLLNSERIKEKGDMFRTIIRECLRKGDVYTQYNGAQYLLLLVGTNRENCEAVFRRIRKGVKDQTGSSVEVDFVVSSLGNIRREDDV